MKFISDVALLDCPRCGEPAKWRLGFWDHGFLFPVIVECLGCNGFLRVYAPTIKEAADGWNDLVAAERPGAVN